MISGVSRLQNHNAVIGVQLFFHGVKRFFAEPYVYSQMVAGRDAKFHGEAKNSWLTGTAAWTFTNISQYILGVYPTHRNKCETAG